MLDPGKKSRHDSLVFEGGASALSGLSRQIAAKKSLYYDALARNNENLDITDWLLYFGKTLLVAKEFVLASVCRSRFKSEPLSRAKMARDPLSRTTPRARRA